jgi:hypothetical protein
VLLAALTLVSGLAADTIAVSTSCASERVTESWRLVVSCDRH